MSTENQPDINKLLDTGKPGLESCSCTQTPSTAKSRKEAVCFSVFSSLFLTRPYGNISHWFYFFFFFLSQKRCIFFPCSFSNTQSSGHPFLMGDLVQVLTLAEQKRLLDCNLEGSITSLQLWVGLSLEISYLSQYKVLSPISRNLPHHG